MSKNVTFSVIIVNYNGGALLQACLDSLKQQIYRDFEIILVDNASQDNSIDTINLEKFPKLRLLRQTQNEGFARANNLAANIATGTWLALLNPDALAAPDWLLSLHAACHRHPEIRVFASAQYCLEDSSRLDGTGDAYLAFGFPWRGGYGYAATTLPEEGWCFSPCGASAAYHRQTFLDYKGFDERFFCYCEDVDLGFRMQMDRLHCLFVPTAKIYHAGSNISGKDSYFTLYHGNRNRTWTLLKNMPFILLMIILPIHIAMLAYIYFRNRKHLPNSGMMQGILDGFRQGWSIRRSHKGKRNPESYLHLIRCFDWNPFKMTSGESAIRPLKQSPPDRMK